MDELPEVPAATISQTIRVGYTLRRELEQAAARAQGGDASWLARKILREQLDVDRSLWPTGASGSGMTPEEARSRPLTPETFHQDTVTQAA